MYSAGSSRYNRYSPGSSGWSILRNEEFQEVDFWAVTWDWERKEIDSYSTAPIISNSSIFSRRQPQSTAALMIPKSITISISSSSPMMNESNTFQQSSAPVNIPDWSKIYGKNPTGDGGGDGGGGDKKNSWDSDEDDEMTVPPHEWIARKLARSQISSFSVYEGLGRTLKGRDLSNVRNGVLTKTGFLE